MPRLPKRRNLRCKFQICFLCFFLNFIFFVFFHRNGNDVEESPAMNGDTESAKKKKKKKKAKEVSEDD